MKEILLFTVLCTFLQFRQYSTFSVQKRRTQSPSDLRNALDVLQRKRRRIDDSPLREELYGGLSDRYLPYDDSIPYRDEYSEGGDNEDFADQYMLANMLNTYPEQYIGYSDENQDESSETETPTIEELKEIFDQIDKNEAKHDENVVEQSESNTDQSSDKISQQQMDELLSEAVKVPSADSKSPSNDKNDDNSPKPVSQDELKDVFKEKITEDNNGEDGTAKFEDINQEYINSDQNNGLSRKKKRMTKRDNNSEKSLAENSDETVLNLVQQVQQLQNKVAQLELVGYLEDKENDYLASALKDATLAQLRNTEAYLEDEYNEIQKALDIEQVLQELKESELEEGEEDTEPVDEKRSESPYKDNLGVWYDEPIPDQGDAQQKLEDFVKQYRKTYNLDDENGLQDDNTSPQEMQVIPTVEDDCPPLDLISSNCQVAALLDIDDEARDLCNRHEICYVCGATVGLSQHDCDAGFRAETVERCTTSSCIQSGAEFLWFIKQDHKYTDAYLEQCDVSCVKKYIVGV